MRVSIFIVSKCWMWACACFAYGRMIITQPFKKLRHVAKITNPINISIKNNPRAPGHYQFVISQGTRQQASVCSAGVFFHGQSKQKHKHQISINKQINQTQIVSILAFICWKEHKTKNKTKKGGINNWYIEIIGCYDWFLLDLLLLYFDR